MAPSNKSSVGYCTQVQWSVTSLKPGEMKYCDWFLLDDSGRLKGSIGFMYENEINDSERFVGTIELRITKFANNVPAKSFYIELSAVNAPRMGIHLLPLTESDFSERDNIAVSLTCFPYNYRLPENVTFRCRVVEYTVKRAVHSHDLPSVYSTFNIMSRELIKYSDVKLKIGDLTIDAHKSILAARSKYFVECFDVVDPPNTVEIDNVDLDTMKEVLTYIYTGLSRLDSNNIYKMLDAAETLKLHHLMGKCAKFLLVNLTLDNVIETLETYYQRFHVTALSQGYIARFVKQHEEHLVKDPKFLELWRDNLQVENLHFVLGLADRHDLDDLTFAAIDFMKQRPNVVERPEFKSVLGEENLMKNILQKIARRMVEMKLESKEIKKDIKRKTKLLEKKYAEER